MCGPGQVPIVIRSVEWRSFGQLRPRGSPGTGGALPFPKKCSGSDQPLRCGVGTRGHLLTDFRQTPRSNGSNAVRGAALVDACGRPPEDGGVPSSERRSQRWKACMLYRKLCEERERGVNTIYIARPRRPKPLSRSGGHEIKGMIAGRAFGRNALERLQRIRLVLYVEMT